MWVESVGASPREVRQVHFFTWDVSVLGAGIEHTPLPPTASLACAGDTQVLLYSRFPFYTTCPQPVLTIHRELCPVTVELQNTCPVPSMVS